MWKEMVRDRCPQAEFQAPASTQAMSQAARQLGGALQEDLVFLLKESNGMKGPLGVELVWPVERIASENLRMRSDATLRELYMPFDSLLFFADVGNGDQFAFPLVAGPTERCDVFCWNHADDSRMWVAAGLERYLEGWLDGSIKV